jgi:quercetin dioxygenase-like cupin family protein
MEKDDPGMHRTDSIDFVYVLSGRCLMRLDDDVTVALSPGDTVIQNGTRHGWRVPYDEPCRLLCISLGGTRTD